MAKTKASKAIKKNPRASSLANWEVSLIKAMLNSGQFANKQDILPYFSRTGRTINHGRISQIANGTWRKDVLPASDAQLQGFLRSQGDLAQAQKAFVDHDPLHPTAVSQLFRIKGAAPATLDLGGENDWAELKQTFNWNNRAAYARTMAGFANNRGGYLIFGVRDGTREIVGLTGSAFADRDPAVISQYLNNAFAPAIRWDKGMMTVGSLQVGLLYVWPSDSKPTVCTTNDGSDLREADIYYRYVGETRRIQFGELQHVLAERERMRDIRWQQTFSRLGEVGIDNAAILNATDGKVTGPGGSFLIDESLLSKISFIREGEFQTKNGAPVLKLIGSVQPIKPQAENKSAAQHSINEYQLVRAFLYQDNIPDSAAYVRWLAHAPSLWLPVYYFLYKASMSVAGALLLLKGEKTNFVNARKKQVERLETARILGPPASAKNYFASKSKLIEKKQFNLDDIEEIRVMLVAVRLLQRTEIDATYLMPLLQGAFERYFYGEGKARLTTEIKYAATHLDAVLWSKKVSK